MPAEYIDRLREHMRQLIRERRTATQERQRAINAELTIIYNYLYQAQ